MTKDCSNDNCPVAATLSLIGGKYKPLIMWHLLDGTLRFGELGRLLPQATPKMLTQQLRELEHDKLVIRTVYPVVPPKVEYSLSELGASIQPVLTEMYHFGSKVMNQKGIPIDCSMEEPSKMRSKT